MHPHASPAELAHVQTPFAEVQGAVAHLRTLEETSVFRTRGLPAVISQGRPDLLRADESPFGAPVRLGINNSPDQTDDSFYVLDVRGVKSTPRSDGQVGRVLGNGARVITSPSATHLLINRHFGDTEELVSGYAGLSPGQDIEISRHSNDKESREVMMVNFGIYPVVTSLYSRKHARVGLGEDGKSISVTDLGSSFGTFVTTRERREAEPTPGKVGRGRRVSRGLRGALLGDGGAQTTNGYGQET